MNNFLPSLFWCLPRKNHSLKVPPFPKSPAFVGQEAWKERKKFQKYILIYITNACVCVGEGERERGGRERGERKVNFSSLLLYEILFIIARNYEHNFHIVPKLYWRMWFWSKLPEFTISEHFPQKGIEERSFFCTFQICYSYMVFCNPKQSQLKHPLVSFHWITVLCY